MVYVDAEEKEEIEEILDEAEKEGKEE